ncbi:MAG: hypothetical protein ABIK31_06475, partial [candidate division WOR-3 bacterium]
MKIKTDKILLFYFFILLVFLIFHIIVNYLSRYNSTKIKDRVERKLNQLDRELEKGIYTINTFKSFDTDSIFEYYSEFKTNFKNTHYFLFYNENLTFWTTNRIDINELQPILVDDVYKLSNGWYRIKIFSSNFHKIVGLYLIKNDYLIQNEYLSNDFNEFLKFPSSFHINKTAEKGIQIFDSNGKFLFSLIYNGKSFIKVDDSLDFLITLFIIIFFELFLIHLILTQNFNQYIKLFLTLFVTSFIIYVTYINKPTSLFQSNLFSPFIYAYSQLIPSLGNLVIYLTVIIIAILY